MQAGEGGNRQIFPGLRPAGQLPLASPGGGASHGPLRMSQRPPNLRLHPRFHSRILRNCRDVVVWLPPGYTADPRRRYPVVYFQDGQNIFDPITSFLGQCWHAGDRARELIKARKIVAPIMVGVYNTGFNRMNEYAPTKAEFTGWDGEKCRSQGDAKRYARFFTTELMPYIAAKYRTLPGPRHTSLVGSSMGALVSLHMAAWHPRDFGAVAALSPSLWWDERAALREFSLLRRKPDSRVWLDIGTAEPGWEVTQHFRDTLIGRGWALGDDLEYREVPGAKHTEAAWAARIGEVLEWLLPPAAPTGPKRR